MSLSDLAHNAPTGGAGPILFGLFADGSGDARFAFAGGRPFEPSRGSSDRADYSPAGDWYGRWAVQPLQGRLAERSEQVGGVCPDDIVVTTRRRSRRV